MIFRRRRVRIEIEQISVRLETGTKAPGFETAASSGLSDATLAPQSAPTQQPAQATPGIPRKQETR